MFRGSGRGRRRCTGRDSVRVCTICRLSLVGVGARVGIALGLNARVLSRVRARALSRARTGG